MDASFTIPTVVCAPTNIYPNRQNPMRLLEQRLFGKRTCHSVVGGLATIMHPACHPHRLMLGRLPTRIFPLEGLSERVMMGRRWIFIQFVARTHG